ncbi:metal-sensitive transcriptional regulator [Sulfobacillus harzensis]|uniref:Metal-sensitive transcriptional regulator n=1 Tax=Sulfobacillus harzensis TaxID=2729629 RepID=A0A7Y0L262_9FIRM|nr:metal-sensitive transcriptional regulator [Sulfobacillus harzensis]NMP21921.1 metal-sensitive transcriptional regulator [Sulfobacillus harzensis]
MSETRTVYWSSRDLQHRLRRVEGQIRGVEAMVARAESCRDILTQLAAIEGALAKVVKLVEACQVAEELVGDRKISGPELDQVHDAIRRVTR